MAPIPPQHADMAARWQRAPQSWPQVARVAPPSGSLVAPWLVSARLHGRRTAESP